MDENTNIRNTAWLLIFIPEIDVNFNVYEVLIDLCN
jgi:hypothetical protein